MGNSKQLQFILPKGRIQAKVIKILTRIGLEFSIDDRSYRPGCDDPDISVKLLKPQNIPSLVSLGRHDCGFTGYDWIVEQDAEVEELIDLGFDPVELVAAVP
ncbi:MAG: ATP phosphoribosyltransferase, partial [Chlorobiales bacterium]|nr:ATP phosphoribosyltransferase [Chlorobiales bacterium]